MDDNDLITLKERIKNMKLRVGVDVGIISYNETPLKKYILNGITTISTNFEQMDLQAAGVPSANVETMNRCPRCENELLFSHRGQSGQAGRFGLVAWME